MSSFLEHERESGFVEPKIRVNDVTLNTTDFRGDSSPKRLTVRSFKSVSSGYCSTKGRNSCADHRESMFLDSSLHLDKSFCSDGSDSDCVIIEEEELKPKTDLELFTPTQNQAFRQNVIDSDAWDVNADEIDELNTTLERVEFILNYAGYEENFSDNRKQLLTEYGLIVKKSAKRRKIEKRTISVDADLL